MNAFDGHSVGWMDMVEEKIIKLEDMSIETFQTDVQKERIKKINKEIKKQKKCLR